MANYSSVGLGWVLTFFSSFGQTFLISLFIPELIQTFNLSEGMFGNIFAVCTVLASILMLTVGHTIDHYPIKRVIGITLLGLASSMLLFGGAFNVIILFIAITGLRLGGQGMMSNVSQSVMSRYFTADRGKALSIASLGYSVGEAIFPVLITLMISNLGWRWAAMASALLILVLLGIMLTRNLSQLDVNPNKTAAKQKQLMREYWGYLQSSKFFLLAPAIFVLPFAMTGIFFYQYVIAESKGWSLTLYSAFFTGFAVSRFVFTLLGGLWVDRFSSKVMFRLYLLPLLVGLIPFALMDHIAGALIFLLLAGASMGMSSPVKSALIAELYGTEKIGTVRSLFTMFMVVSTAIGPILVGNLMDFNVELKWIIGLIFLLVMGAIVNCQRAHRFFDLK